ncbi:MAG TPA: proton-conducting transporter membrane subunit, partial [Kribbellaceae bacterium]
MTTLFWRLTGIAVALAALAVAAASYDHEPRVIRVGDGTLAGQATLLFNVRADDLSVLMLVIVGVVGACVHVYSIGYLHERRPSYHAIVTLFTLAMVTVVVADSLFLLLIGWEVMGTCSYLLIGHHWERRDARAGAVKAFLMTRLGDVGFLFGIFVIGVAAGTFQISEIDVSRLAPATLTVGTLLLLSGVVGKSAQVPLQTWLPDAMPGPAPVSALIHAATMVAAGVFLVARMYDVFRAAPGALPVLAVLASLTMVVAALCATAAVEVKRVLAWSTVS